MTVDVAASAAVTPAIARAFIEQARHKNYAHGVIGVRARPEATRAEVMAAARAAFAHDFIEALPRAVEESNLYLALGKSTVFGVAIALIGCHWGLWVKPNTQSLGEGTTASVVTAITAVIIIDALFAVAFKSVGI